MISLVDESVLSLKKVWSIQQIAVTSKLSFRPSLLNGVTLNV